MPLLWMFSNLVLLMVLLIMVLIYSMGYYSFSSFGNLGYSKNFSVPWWW